MSLTILYRGGLSSCNYGCEYCPFAKKVETKAEHEADGVQLERFLRRVEQLDTVSISIFFTPWGEALIHKRYQDAIAALSKMPQVQKVAIQTNLSCKLDWLNNCRIDRIGIWATYHPGETDRVKFLQQCGKLDEANIQYSVGVVGLKEHLIEIGEMRKSLRSNVYLWVNAYKRENDYYSAEELGFLQNIDSLFHLNNQYHASLGRSCRSGSSVISVDGEGNIRRCHFISTTIANIYDDNFRESLVDKPCTNNVCGCHIGYVHMNELDLYKTFGGGVLERVPVSFGYETLQ